MTKTECLMFLAGAGCGAAIALVFAPASGVDLRNQVASKVAEGQRAVKDTVYEAIGGIRGAVNRNVEIVDHTMKEGVAAFKEAREVYQRA